LNRGKITSVILKRHVCVFCSDWPTRRAPNPISGSIRKHCKKRYDLHPIFFYLSPSV